MFARHIFDIERNSDSKVNLTPIDSSPACCQNLPTANNLEEDIAVELALLHNTAFLPYYHLANAQVRFLPTKKTNR